MNVNTLNSIYSMQKVTSTPAFKASVASREVEESPKKQNMSGLEALAAMLTPHKHYVEVDFSKDEFGKTFKLTSGMATIDDKEKEVVSSLTIDKKEGKSRTDIIRAILRDTTNLKEFSFELGNKSVISVVPVSGKGQNFVTTLTKDGKTSVVQEYGFSKNSPEMTDVEAYKKAINIAMSTFNPEEISKVTVATQR